MFALARFRIASIINSCVCLLVDDVRARISAVIWREKEVLDSGCKGPVFFKGARKAIFSSVYLKTEKFSKGHQNGIWCDLENYDSH